MNRLGRKGVVSMTIRDESFPKRTEQAAHSQPPSYQDGVFVLSDPDQLHNFIYNMRQHGSKIFPTQLQEQGDTLISNTYQGAKHDDIPMHLQIIEEKLRQQTEEVNRLSKDLMFLKQFLENMMKIQQNTELRIQKEGEDRERQLADLKAQVEKQTADQAEIELEWQRTIEDRNERLLKAIQSVIGEGKEQSSWLQRLIGAKHREV